MFTVLYAEKLKQHPLHNVEVDFDEGRRQSKIAANSKSYAVFQTTYVSIRIHAVWDAA